MRLTMQHTLGEIMELNRFAREQRIKAWLIILLGLGHIVVGGWVAVPDPTLAFVAGGLFLLLGLFSPCLAGLGAWRRTQRTPWEIEVGSEGIIFLKGSEQILAPWAFFYRWFQTKNLLVLMGPGDALAIPKRICGEGEWEELRAMVQKGLGNPSCC